MCDESSVIFSDIIADISVVLTGPNNVIDILNENHD